MLMPTRNILPNVVGFILQFDNKRM